jgi:hypothetical protein
MCGVKMANEKRYPFTDSETPTATETGNIGGEPDQQGATWEKSPPEQDPTIVLGISPTDQESIEAPSIWNKADDYLSKIPADGFKTLVGVVLMGLGMPGGDVQVTAIQKIVTGAGILITGLGLFHKGVKERARGNIERESRSASVSPEDRVERTARENVKRY